MKTNKNIVGIVVFILVIVGLFYASSVLKNRGNPFGGPGKLDTFAQCLKDKGAIFYGAFWCPHCQNQKKLFGDSVKLLPYVECSTADGKGQLDVCKEKKIEGYPTWIFADGTRESGELTLEHLAEKTSCVLPKN